MKFQMPDELRKALETTETFCAITEVNSEPAVLVKLPAAEQAFFRGAPVKYGYEIALYPEGPVICLALSILDDPEAPFNMETFLNVANEHDLALARRLANHPTLTLHFLDECTAYTFSKQLRHRPVTRRELAAMIDQALAYFKTVTRPNWQAARQRFMREVQR